MPTIKSNALAVKAVLGKDRESYTIEGHKGLYLQARGDGTGSWVLRYRVNGKQREHTLHNDAKHADLSEVLKAKDAWRTAAKVQGRDLKAEQAARIEELRKAEVVDALTYDAAYALWLERRQSELRPRSLEEYDRVHRLHIQPRFGATPIARLQKGEIREHFERSAKAAVKRGVAEGNGERGLQAAKALKQMGAVLAWCVDRDMLDKDPTRGIEPPASLVNPKGKQARPLNDSELRAIWNCADTRMNRHNSDMLKLALLLGRRASEIAGASKSELQLAGQNPHWLIPTREGNKSGLPSYVPLPSLARQLLKNAVHASGNSEWLFPSAEDPNLPSKRHGPSLAFMHLRRKIGIADQVRLHDVRGLLVDQMLSMGVPPNVVSHVLHHTGDMKGSLAMSAYRTYDMQAEKLRALRLWQCRLLSIVRGRPRVLRW